MQSPDDGAGDAAKDPVVQQLMGVKLHTDLRCEETEEAIQEEGTAFSLKCNITSEVNHLSEGLKLGLEDDREKTSSQLGRLALFKVTAIATSMSLASVRRCEIGCFDKSLYCKVAGCSYL